MKLNTLTKNVGTLTERHKADRQAMVAHVVELCQRYAVAHTVAERFLGQPQCTAVKMEGPQGLSLTLDFDGESCQPDVFVLSWHMVYNKGEGYVIAPAFSRDINPYHRRKATDVCYGFGILLEKLEERFITMNKGLAVMLNERED